MSHPDHSPVNLSTSGPPETILELEPQLARQALAEALNLTGMQRHLAISGLVARWPDFIDGWAQLGEAARDMVEAYACFRVGYHRGLDRLRQSGWRGSGLVRWEHPGNQGFLHCLEGLRRTAEMIGEKDEAERCAVFLRQLDPEWNEGKLSHKLSQKRR